MVQCQNAIIIIPTNTYFYYDTYAQFEICAHFFFVHIFLRGSKRVDGTVGAFLYLIDEANEDFKHWWAVLMWPCVVGGASLAGRRL